jgi:hypothetical protein
LEKWDSIIVLPVSQILDWAKLANCRTAKFPVVYIINNLSELKPRHCLLNPIILPNMQTVGESEFMVKLG